LFITRRTLIQGAAAAVSSTSLYSHQQEHPGVHLAQPHVPKLVDPNNLAAFVDPLPIPRKATPIGTKAVPNIAGVQAPLFRIPIAEFESKVHRDVPATRFWGYGGALPDPTIEVRSGEGIHVDWPHELPARHFLPIDHNLMGAETDKPEVRAIVHVHGAKVPPESDGYPENWYVPGRTATVYYPNAQEAALLWYHDHTMGINRLNVYAGMVGLYMFSTLRTVAFTGWHSTISKWFI
jgi:spore coat protein A, manganese oxidase